MSTFRKGSNARNTASRFIANSPTSVSRANPSSSLPTPIR